MTETTNETACLDCDRPNADCICGHDPAIDCTPEEWTAPSAGIWSKGGKIKIADLGTEGTVNTMRAAGYDDHRIMAEITANSTLMAASKNLLEALRACMLELYAFHRETTETRAALDLGHAAIRKATVK